MQGILVEPFFDARTDRQGGFSSHQEVHSAGLLYPWPERKLIEELVSKVRLAEQSHEICKHATEVWVAFLLQMYDAKISLFSTCILYLVRGESCSAIRAYLYWGWWRESCSACLYVSGTFEGMLKSRPIYMQAPWRFLVLLGKQGKIFWSMTRVI